MATQVQSQLSSQIKAEKESQMSEEAWRETIKTDRIGKVKAKPDLLGGYFHEKELAAAGRPGAHAVRGLHRCRGSPCRQ